MAFLHRLSDANSISGVGSFAAILVSVIMWSFGLNPAGVGESTPEQHDNAKGALAEALLAQWQREAVRRGVLDKTPARVSLVLEDGVGAPVSLPAPPTGSTEDYAEHIYTAYQQVRSKRLLILGDGGSGKSSAAVLLLLQILEKRTDVEPVPVLLTLASWDPSSDFSHWAANRLRENYRFLSQASYGGTAADRLADGNRLLLILDGFDELVLPSSGKDRALEALNKAFHANRPVVITSRASMFSTAPNVRLTGRNYEAKLGAIEPDELADYLQAEDDPVLRARWVAVDHKIRNPGTIAYSVLKTPLYASLARTAYEDLARDPDELFAATPFNTRAKLQAHLVTIFIQSAFDRELATAKPRRRLHRKWGTPSRQRGLRFLAKHLSANDQHDIAWWRLYELLSENSWIVPLGLVAGFYYLATADLPGGLRRAVPMGFTFTTTIGLSRGRVAGWSAAWRVTAASFLAIAAAGWHQIGLVPGAIDGVEISLALGMIIGMGGAFSAVSWRQVLHVGWRVALTVGVLMAVVDGIRYGAPLGLARLAQTAPGTFIVVSAPGLFINRLKVPEPPAAPARLNAKLVGRKRLLLGHIVIGFAAGFFVSLAGGIVAGVRHAIQGGSGFDYGTSVALAYGLSIGLGVGMGGGLVRWLNHPSNLHLVSGPVSTLRSARVSALLYIVSPTIFGALSMWLVRSLGHSGAVEIANDLADAGVSPTNGAKLGVCLGLVLASCLTAWPALIVAELVLVSSKRVPFRLVRLCAQASAQEVLRQEGPVFQFRHKELRERLKTWPG